MARRNNREEFDITSEIFLKRVLGVTQFWKSGFLNVGGQKTELYGPIWMVATYVLTAGVAANLNSFFTTSYPFQFSNQPFYAIIGILIIVLGLQIFLYPAIIGCLGGFIKSNDVNALIYSR